MKKNQQSAISNQPMRSAGSAECRVLNADSHLTPAQLCDLLNYALELPRKIGIGNRTVRNPAINPCVASTWLLKRRVRVEAWCEACLREANVLPAQRRPAGRIPGRYMPRELAQWALERFPGGRHEESSDQPSALSRQRTTGI